MQNEDKFCVNCKHYLYKTCFHDNNFTKPSSVDGKSRVKFGDIYFTRNHNCKGDWFEPKETLWQKLKLKLARKT